MCRFVRAKEFTECRGRLPGVTIKWSYITTKKMLFPKNTDTTPGLAMPQPEIDWQKPKLIAPQPVLIDPGPGLKEERRK